MVITKYIYAIIISIIFNLFILTVPAKRSMSKWWIKTWMKASSILIQGWLLLIWTVQLAGAFVLWRIPGKGIPARKCCWTAKGHRRGRKDDRGKWKLGEGPQVEAGRKGGPEERSLEGKLGSWTFLMTVLPGPICGRTLESYLESAPHNPLSSSRKCLSLLWWNRVVCGGFLTHAGSVTPRLYPVKPMTMWITGLIRAEKYNSTVWRERTEQGDYEIQGTVCHGFWGSGVPCTLLRLGSLWNE